MPDWLQLLIIFPAVCGIIGYVTNVLAVKMIFHPYRRVSVLGIGFQGVLPKHQAHFAREMAKVVTRDFMTTDDLVEHLNQETVLDELEPLLRRLFEQVLTEVKDTVDENKRMMLQPAFVDSIVDQLIVDARARVPELLAEIKQRAGEALNLEDLITEKIIAIGPVRLKEIIYEVSRKELVFIEWYGGIFGFLLGLLQWGVLQWLGDIALPIVGALVGTVTNYLAIQMLFYPREPKRYLGIKYQGLFPARQHEISVKLGEVAAREFIVPREIFSILCDRVIPENATLDQVQEAEAALRREVPQLAMMGDSMLSAEEREELRHRAIERFPEMVPEVKTVLVELASRHIDVHEILSVKIKQLSKSAFEGLLRGLFQREELYLVIYGALLGGAVGALQLGIVAALQ